MNKNKHSVNYSALENNIVKRSFRINETELNSKFISLGFDIVKFKDGDVDQLWQVQSSDDGDYIISMYPETTDEVVTKTASVKHDWAVSMTRQADLNFFYKGEYLVRMAGSKLGFKNEELDEVCRMLPGTLVENKVLVASLLSEMPVQGRADLVKKFPELA